MDRLDSTTVRRARLAHWLALLAVFSGGSVQGELVFSVGSVTAELGSSSILAPINVSGAGAFNSVTIAFGVGDGGPGLGGVDPVVPVIDFTAASAGAVWDGLPVIANQITQADTSVSLLTMNLTTPVNLTAEGVERLMTLTLDLSSVTSVANLSLTANFGGDNAAAFTAPDAAPAPLTFAAGELIVEAIGAPPGDFNADGQVNAVDYTVWRDGLGESFTPSDYTWWATSYDSTVPKSATAVPEAGTAVMVSIALTVLHTMRRRRHAVGW